LLAGAGELIVYENLTQAERELVYEVRTFERYKRELAFDLAQRLLRLHQDLERIENERRNFENVKDIRERNEALSAAGRLSAIQVDQARQNELSSEDRLITTRQVYAGSLDSFKLLLGLPMAVELTIDPAQLELLAAGGEGLGDLGSEHALKLARASRPDFLTAVDRVVDAERRSRVAADALRMGLDITSSVDVSSETNKPLRYNFQDVSWSLGILLDLPVARLPQRNAYRSSLIQWQSATRSAEEFEDGMASDLRDELRSVKARKESTRIQQSAVLLAERRVESVGLNQQAGRANTRDLLEAQDALVSSRNAETRAIIDLTLARLELGLDLGLLRVDENGIRMESVPIESAQEEAK
jgi:outer membrane protein TolC